MVVTFVMHKPPPIEYESVLLSPQRESSGDSFEFSCWGELTRDSQTYLIQDWLARPWQSLAEFCFYHCVDYESFRRAFSSRALLNGKLRRYRDLGAAQIIAPNEVPSELTRALGKSLKIQNLLSSRLETSLARETLTLQECSRLLGNVTQDSVRLAITLKTITESGHEVPVSGTKETIVVMPQDVKRFLARNLASIGEHSVRRLEMKEREEENGNGGVRADAAGSNSDDAAASSPHVRPLRDGNDASYK